GVAVGAGAVGVMAGAVVDVGVAVVMGWEGAIGVSVEVGLKLRLQATTLNGRTTSNASRNRYGSALEDLPRLRRAAMETNPSEPKNAPITPMLHGVYGLEPLGLAPRVRKRPVVGS